jgi:hypothetical protein
MLAVEFLAVGADIQQAVRGFVRFFRESWRELIGALLVLLSRIATMPRSPWENDEFLFAEGVRKFDPSLYHPHPPGYPLYILLGKAFEPFTNDPWRALVALAIVCAPIGFFALAKAFRNWIGDADLAVGGALVFYFSASMLVHGTLAMSDGAAIMFLALTFWAVSSGHDDVAHERNAIAVGLWSSCAIGCRPQLLIPMLPLLAIALLRMRTVRQRLSSIIAFGFASLMWFLPLMDAAGGPNALFAYEFKQAAYFASHDAAMSRGSMSALQIALRFLLHPWGSKYVTIPLLALLAFGVGGTLRRWRVLLPILAFTAVQLVFELVSMDPADAARYHLPAMLLFAFVVACGFETIMRATGGLRATPWIAAAFMALLAFLYIRPIVATRTHVASPPAAAAAFARTSYPPNTVVLYDLSLRPAAEYLMPFSSTAIEKGLQRYYDRPDVPLVLFVNGGTKAAEAHAFLWPDSDAYGKLTRNFYREVTLDPVRPAERYLPLRGVYALERTISGDEWRWLGADSAIRLPSHHTTSLSLALRLSPDAPYESNRVHVSINGRETASIDATKAAPASIAIALPDGPIDVAMHAERSFSPASVLHNQDPRTLAVQLVGVEQR